jgi:hypothetical protein
MRMDGTWLALGAAGVLAAAAGVRRGSVNELPGTVLERAAQIRQRFQGDEPGYLAIARLVATDLSIGGRLRFPTPGMWATWTEPDPDPSFARFVDTFWRLWKGGTQQAQRRAQQRAKGRQRAFLASPKAQVLRVLHDRARQPFERWLSEQDLMAQAEQGAADRLELFAQWLDDVPMLSVRDDGLVQVDHDLSDGNVRRLIGDLPVVMFHGTSTKLLPKIRREGLRPARSQQQKSDPTFSTASGVYLDLRPDVEVYARGAASRHGGKPVILAVRRTLDQIEPDPDDAHLGWSTSAMQFITPWVPVTDIVEWK